MVSFLTFIFVFKCQIWGLDLGWVYESYFFVKEVLLWILIKWVVVQGDPEDVA